MMRARHRDRFRTSHSEMFSYTEDVRTDQYEQESAQIQRESQVKRILDRLDERERQIVTARFGLIRGHEPLTLTQVGAAMGVTKERIRQIQVSGDEQIERGCQGSANRVYGVKGNRIAPVAGSGTACFSRSAAYEWRWDNGYVSGAASEVDFELSDD